MLKDQSSHRTSHGPGTDTQTSVLPQSHDAGDLANTPLHSAVEKILYELGEIRAVLAGVRKPYLTVEEVAQLTGRSAYTVRRWISEKRLEARRVAGIGARGRLLIASEQVNSLIRDGKGSKIPSVYAGDC